MSDRESLPKGFESPYQAFLWRELGIIRELEREGEYYRALHYSTTLQKYLSPELRKKLGNKGEEIMVAVNHVADQEGKKTQVWFTSQVVKNRVAGRLGYAYLQHFIRLLSDSMGERLYMEKRGRKVFQGKYEG